MCALSRARRRRARMKQKLAPRRPLSMQARDGRLARGYAVKPKYAWLAAVTVAADAAAAATPRFHGPRPSFRHRRASGCPPGVVTCVAISSD